MILPSRIDDWLRQALRRKGYVFMRRTNPYHYLGRRLMLMRSYGIDLVLDVGANTGQYAKLLRKLGYQGEIVSFEPMRAPFLELLRNCENDAAWSCRDYALGDVEGVERIHVSGNSVSSSILPMLAEHERHAPASHVIAQEEIAVRRLDALPDWLGWSGRSIWLKIDVQGYEEQVLAGAAAHQDKIKAIQVELSLRPLYSQQLTMLPMLKRLDELGFDPVAFEPGFADMTTGEYLQVDGIFRNRRAGT